MIKIIELRNSLNDFLAEQLESRSNNLIKIKDEQLALIKINKIIDTINLGFYNNRDCINEIIKILHE